MKFYEIIIQPTSGFGTALKGDTIFGHFCWQAGYDSELLNGGIEKQINLYFEKPFAVFSSAMPVIEKDSNHYVFRRPHLPLSMLFKGGKDKKERLKITKENKKRIWMINPKGLYLNISSVNFIDDEELCHELSGSFTEVSEEFMAVLSQPHNTINRLTGTTGTGMFAPYTRENYYFPIGSKLVLFVLIDTDATDIERIVKGLKRMGVWGFGRDASIGMGRFAVCSYEELKFPDDENASGCYTLAPSVPDSDLFKKTYYNPFVRFGKHGDRLANGKNPFKNPIIMADEAAVFIPKDQSFFKKQYIGKALTHVSKTMPETVVQGYTPYLPIILEQ
ncbi:MAG: CRISPR-associated protein Csm4 [Desulfobacteraceae bacterium Eth-SRB2]|nr:MAG: CRISPR-associated protein Csm4 [Desulfobacteraceae bacterium Eth-SRB2]